MTYHVCVAERQLRGEDGHVVCNDHERWLLAAVIDGHGGRGAMLCVQTRLAVVALALLEGSTVPPLDEVLRGALKQLSLECRLLADNSGCCLTALLLDKESGRFALANLGDAHAVHITPSSYRVLTESHRLQDNARERSRVADFVGYVQSPCGGMEGPPRLFPGGLACARSLGDADCPHVRDEPFVASDVLGSRDTVLMASDGVWDSKSMGKIVARAREAVSADAVLRMASSTLDDATALIVTRVHPRARRRRVTALFGRNGSESSFDGSDENESLKVVV